MKRIGFFTRLALRSLLGSALTLENKIHGLFASLAQELGGIELPKGLDTIVDEERHHKQLIRNIIQNRLSPEELAKTMESKSFHRPEDVKSLDPVTQRELVAKIEQIEKHEEGILNLYESLYGKSKIPFVKEAFRFLAQQEKTHLVLLRKLLGKA